MNQYEYNNYNRLFNFNTVRFGNYFINWIYFIDMTFKSKFLINGTVKILGKTYNTFFIRCNIETENLI